MTAGVKEKKEPAFPEGMKWGALAARTTARLRRRFGYAVLSVGAAVFLFAAVADAGR